MRRVPTISYQSVRPGVVALSHDWFNAKMASGNLFHRLYVEAGDFVACAVPWYRQ